MVTTPNFDLDVDTTLGGSSASDYIIPSQKAIKAYVDNNSGATVDQTYDATSSNAQSGLAIAGELLKYPELASNEDITGVYNFIGQKRITFSQSSASDKLGFTCFNISNTEIGAFEYRPNTIGNGALFNVNVPVSSSNYVGFRYWGTPAVNVVAGKHTTAGTYYITTHITDGNTTVTASNKGIVDIGSLIPNTSNLANVDLQNISATGQNVIDNSIYSIIDTLYPVGSVFIGTMAVCPIEALGIGTWQLVSNGKVLQGSDANNTAGSSVSASLPQLTANSNGDHSHNRGTMEITGGWNIRHAANSSSSQIAVMSGGSGAISVSAGSGGTTSSSLSYAGNSSKQDVATLKASNGWSGSTNTTGAHTHTVEWTGNVGTTVQPPAYIVNIWERTA